MTERVYARPIENGLWQWRVADGQGGWQSEEYATGDNEALQAALPNSSTPVTLIVPGADVMACDVPSAGLDKKHLAKMLPFELEDQVIDPVENLHMSYGEMGEESVPVHYIKTDKFASILAPLTEVGCEVVESIPDFTLLEVEANTIALLYDGQSIIVNIGNSRRFTTDAQLAKPIFERLEIDFDAITRLELIAETYEELEKLHTWIPEVWDDDFEISMNESHFWNRISSAHAQGNMNLRRGEFARRLPFERWAQIWKIPAAAMGVAFIVATILMAGEYFVAKGEAKQIRKNIQEVYLKAVPNGKKGDEEGRLRAMLKNVSKTGSQPTNLMDLLGGVSKVIGQMDTVKLSNFRYNGDQRELQVTIEIKSLNELNQFKEKLEGQGLKVDSPRSSAQGDAYQARMKISEAV